MLEQPEGLALHHLEIHAGLEYHPHQGGIGQNLYHPVRPLRPWGRKGRTGGQRRIHESGVRQPHRSCRSYVQRAAPEGALPRPRPWASHSPFPGPAPAPAAWSGTAETCPRPGRQALKAPVLPEPRRGGVGADSGLHGERRDVPSPAADGGPCPSSSCMASKRVISPGISSSLASSSRSFSWSTSTHLPLSSARPSVCSKSLRISSSVSSSPSTTSLGRTLTKVSSAPTRRTAIPG